MSDVTGRETAQTASTRPLLDADFLQNLERATLAAAQPFSGRARPPRRAARRGDTSGSEAMDEASGAPETRPRRRALPAPPKPAPLPSPATSPQDLEVAALSHLFQGTLVLPRDLSLHILVDGSQSMLLPPPGTDGNPSKFQYARRLAGALGYAALVRYGRVNVTCFASAMGRRTPTLRNRNDAHLLLDYLKTARAGGESFARVLEHYATRNARPGVCVVISDFLDPQWEKGIRALLSRRFQVVLLQVLSPSETSPHLAEDLRLVDAETGQTRDVTPSAIASVRYQAALNRFFAMLHEAAGRNGMGYLRISTSTNFEEPLLSTLHRAGQ